MKSLIKPFIRKTEGSFTVEASLVLPIVLFVTMILLFFCLYVYQQSFLHQTASAVAERSAYSWDNSHKEAATGAVAKGQYDSLYWRLSDDGMLGVLFGWSGLTDKKQTVALPGTEETTGALPILKLNHSGTMVSSEMKGEISYQNSILQRKISVGLNRVLSLPPLNGMLKDGSNVITNANSAVVEPMEFIRTVDLMRYYGSKFKGSGGNEKTDPGSAKEVLNKFKH
ncbi:pilus assembly protein [Paenibacillus sp. HJL G12]|uniref:Pilus assembly protein n=1 Tax=Paenibacillus dendrobii TaxID=2691084 RepID=A0A7X3LHP1_9BACL|nr:TadE family protein [Paenibacillus dendrobii]MWV44405.1 pilus assembly protein [Paenibacillus dendrobii]